jgi:hypothetical protein
MLGGGDGDKPSSHAARRGDPTSLVGLVTDAVSAAAISEI